MMPTHSQHLHKVYFNHLKSLEEVEVSFEPHVLTAVMGPNRCGKTTILHALACSFMPSLTDEGYTFPYFFRTNSDTNWSGSKYTIYYSYKENGDAFDNQKKEFSKLKDRWGPKYYKQKRPIRNVVFIDIMNSVPLLEIESGRAGVLKYNRTSLNGNVENWIKQKAGYILNVDYQSYDLCKYANNKKKSMYGVKANNITYSTVSMSAGEQRVFRILEEVANAVNSSLILIDEMSLFLHEFALKRLIEVLKNKANQKKLQIVFTSHFPGIVNMYNEINVRHLHSSKQKTMCFLGYQPDAIYRLTGEPEKPYEIYCEDQLSKKIIEKVALNNNMKRYIDINCYGAATNCFTMCASLILKEGEKDNVIYVLDGDCYEDDDKKRAQINNVLTGDSEHDKERREMALNKIIQFCTSEGKIPEEVLSSYIKGLNKDGISGDEEELYEIVFDTCQLDDYHKLIDICKERIGVDKDTVITTLVKLASKSEEWASYTQPVTDWIIEKKREQN